MRSDESSTNDLSQRMVQVIDWVHRTGWPTRERDTAMAAQVFDVWLAATEGQRHAGGQRDRSALLDALHAVFSAGHDDEAAEHLCALFAVTLESHLRSREHRDDDAAT